MRNRHKARLGFSVAGVFIALLFLLAPSPFLSGVASASGDMGGGSGGGGGGGCSGSTGYCSCSTNNGVTTCTDHPPTTHPPATVPPDPPATDPPSSSGGAAVSTHTKTTTAPHAASTPAPVVVEQQTPTGVLSVDASTVDSAPLRTVEDPNLVSATHTPARSSGWAIAGGLVLAGFGLGVGATTFRRQPH